MAVLLSMLGVLVFPAPAHATVSMQYNGSLCQGSTRADETRLSETSGDLKATSLNGGNYVEVVCPIIKRTSGPGIGDDGVSVSITGSGHVTCEFDDYMTTQAWGTTNVGWEMSDSNTSGNYVMSLGGDFGNYWGDSTHFSYSELHCQLDVNAHITNYTVYESGTVQSGRRIVSAAYCSQTAASNYGYFQGDPFIIYTSPGQPGGFVEVLGGSTGFKAHCAMPASSGSYVEVALGPAFNSYKMGCQRANGTGYKYVTGGQWDTGYVVLPSSGGVDCFMQNDPPDGDGKIFAYRTQSSSTF
jgi:hypothetical protein